MSTLQHVAARYAARGLVVIPVRGKRAVIPWRDFVDRPPTEAEMARFPWDRATGLALILGPATWQTWRHAWCLDVEVEHRAAAEAWLDRHVPRWRAGAVVQTGGGGLHLYFRASRPVATRVISWGEVRGQGAYCVLPPARHPDTGHPYRWRVGGDGWQNLIPLEPEVVPGYLGDGAPAGTAGTMGAGVLAHTPGDGASPLDVRAALAGAPLGRRNITLFRVACKLRAADVPQEWATRLVAEAAAQCNPPWGADPREEAPEDLVARVYQRYPPNRPARALVEAGEPALLGALAPLVGAATLVPVTALKDDADTDEAAWLPVLGQDGLVARGAATLLSSRPKAGKSTLLAHCTRQWLAAGLVVAWLTEEPTAVWRQRRRMLPQLNTDRLFLGFPSLGTTAEAWLTALRDVRPGVIIVDTLRAFMGIADENDAAVVHHRLTPWVLLARELDAALVLSHHRNKMGGEEGIDHAGSHAFVGAVDVAISLREVADAPRRRELVCRSRFETTPAALLVELEEGGAYRVLGEPAEVAFTEVRERVREALTGEWQTRDEVYAALADPKPNREYVRRALHSLVAAGLAERQAGRGNTPDRWRAVDPAHPVHPSTTGINVVDHDGVGRMDMVGAAHDTADAAGIGGCDSGNSLTPPELLRSSTDSWEEQGDAAARLLTLLSLAEAAGWPRLPIRPGVVVAPGEACWRRFARTAPVDDLRAAQAALAALVSTVSTVSSGTDPDLDGEGDLADLADLADLPF